MKNRRRKWGINEKEKEKENEENEFERMVESRESATKSRDKWDNQWKAGVSAVCMKRMETKLEKVGDQLDSATQIAD